MREIICGIYKITNKINGKIYIGQSYNILERWERHKRTSDNCAIHKALQKYGVDNFVFEILEKCSKSELDEREKYWIKYYNSFITGYNMTSGGSEIINPIKKEVKQYSLEGEYITTYESLKAAGIANDIDPRYISNCCLQKSRSAKGFQWCFVGNEKDILKNYNPEKNKKVNQYDLNGKYLRTFDSLKQACEEVNGKSATSISKCCKLKRQQAYGFQWRYFIDKDITENIEPYKKNIGSAKSVSQFDLNDNYIATYNSILEASKKTNLNDSSISRTCAGKQRTYGGFKWKYTNNDVNSKKGE